MNDKALLSQDWDDLVFENRNKEYGAYTLRKQYTFSVTGATLIAIALVAFIFLLPGILSRFFGNEITLQAKDNTAIELTDPNLLIPKPKTKKPVTQSPLRSGRGGAPVLTMQNVEEDSSKTSRLQPVETGTPGGEPAGDPPVETGGGGGTVPTGTPVAETPEPIRDHAEIMPEYIGGYHAMARFVGDRLKYPASAKRIGMEGKVFVQFVVQNDGSVSDVQVLRGVQGDIDREAARVIALMPNWKPARMGERTVAVKMVLPVLFHLDSGN